MSSKTVYHFYWCKMYQQYIKFNILQFQHVIIMIDQCFWVRFFLHHPLVGRCVGEDVQVLSAGYLLVWIYFITPSPCDFCNNLKHARHLFPAMDTYGTRAPPPLLSAITFLISVCHIRVSVTCSFPYFKYAVV